MHKMPTQTGDLERVGVGRVVEGPSRGGDSSIKAGGDASAEELQLHRRKLLHVDRMKTLLEGRARPRQSRDLSGQGGGGARARRLDGMQWVDAHPTHDGQSKPRRGSMHRAADVADVAYSHALDAFEKVCRFGIVALARPSPRPMALLLSSPLPGSGGVRPAPSIEASPGSVLECWCPIPRYGTSRHAFGASAHTALHLPPDRCLSPTECLLKHRRHARGGAPTAPRFRHSLLPQFPSLWRALIRLQRRA